MKKRNLLLVMVFLFVSIAVNAQRYSDIIDINTLISAMVNDSYPGSSLSKKGYKHLKQNQIEGLGSHNGVEIYYKNCTVDREGMPTSFSKGNSSIVMIVSVGFGTVISLQVFNRGAYDNICMELVNMGYQLYNDGINGDQSYRKGDMIIDISRAGKSYQFTINSPR